MRKFLIILILLPMVLNAQNSTNQDQKKEPARDVTVNEQGHVTIRWNFPEYASSRITENNTEFSKIWLEGFGFLHQQGKPDLPAYTDHIATPENSNVNIEISQINYHNTQSNIFVYPSQPPRQDNYQANEPPFTMDTVFYNQDRTFPENIFRLDESQDLRDIKIAKLNICPFRYNPAKRKLRQIKTLKVKITYNGKKRSLTNAKMHSDHFATIVQNFFLNGNIIAKQIKNSSSKSQQVDPNYLILTTQQYHNAAKKLAEWKSQLGYKTEIITKTNWNSSNVKNEIHTRYSSYTPKPDYFVIIGDQGDIPGEILSNSGASYASDLYYSCMGGPGDYTPDMAKGRISVTSLSQAQQVIEKIIQYEKTPVMDSSFYNTGLNCAYFQHDNNGYAERRFAQTSEELRTYAVNRGYNVNRVYTTGSNVYPTNWNNGLYSNGEPIPSNLQKPTFAWNGNKNDIINHVNSGTFYVFHRDHGYVHGWGDPAFSNSDVNSFNNANYLPVFFSINCLTGKFNKPECFSEKLLRKNNGGAVGVFGHAEVSYTGYNDALALGVFDGIWSNPGLVPNFTGSGGISNPNVQPHGDIRTMGDLGNHALSRMEATWGTSQYTHELFHYFGDPSMRIRVDYPTPITASNDDSISCNSDTMLVINNINTSPVTATLVEDRKIAGKDTLHGNSDTLYFTPVVGDSAFLTLSKAGYNPYVDTITITGGCPEAKITMSTSKMCTGDSLTFTSQSSGNIASYSWNFDSTASMVSSNSAGPHTIAYATSGQKKVSLTVTTPSSLSHTDSLSFYIDSVCKYSLPNSGNNVIEKCSGRLFDNGGKLSPYSNNSSGSVTINPPGASSISLTFTSFHYEKSYDYLKIYDGTSTSAPLIGSYDGTSLPSGGVVTSTSGSITIKQETDTYVNESGFELDWQCSYPNTPPSANFTVSDSTSCTGFVKFTDKSLFGPSNWVWNFGDGTTSTQQHPLHKYTSNGTYSVKLKVSNSIGKDSVIKNNVVTVNMPSTPITHDSIRCKTGTVQLEATTPSSSTGYIRWFANSTSQSAMDTGKHFTTPIISSDKTYYVDHAKEKPSLYGAKTDKTGTGEYYSHNYERFLFFDVHKPSKLVSVKVYSNSSGYRTIKLRDNNGNVLDTKTTMINTGKQRITLNFDLSPGQNYELAGPKSPDLYRNEGSSLSYPYKVSDLITITQSNASSDPTGYYYYFYDWEVKGPPCHSPRKAIEAKVSDTLKPITDFSYSNNDPEIQFHDNSKFTQTHYWSFGDGQTSNLPDPDHTYTANGNYDVQLKTVNNCGSDSLTKQIQINAAAIEQYKKNQLEAFPNPASDFVNIEVPEEAKGEIILQVINKNGQHIEAQAYSAKENNQIQKDIKHLAAGAYFFLLHTQEKTYLARIIVN